MRIISRLRRGGHSSPKNEVSTTAASTSLSPRQLSTSSQTQTSAPQTHAARPTASSTSSFASSAHTQAHLPTQSSSPLAAAAPPSNKTPPPAAEAPAAANDATTTIVSSQDASTRPSTPPKAIAAFATAAAPQTQGRPAAGSIPTSGSGPEQSPSVVDPQMRKAQTTGPFASRSDSATATTRRSRTDYKHDSPPPQVVKRVGLSFRRDAKGQRAAGQRKTELQAVYISTYCLRWEKLQTWLSEQKDFESLPFKKQKIPDTGSDQYRVFLPRQLTEEELEAIIELQDD